MRAQSQPPAQIAQPTDVRDDLSCVVQADRRPTTQCGSTRSPERRLRHYEFPLLDGDNLSSDLCRHSLVRLGCAIWIGNCCSAMCWCSCCFPWPATATASVLRSVNAREYYDRYLPCSLFLILGKNRHLLGLAGEQPLALLASRHRRPDPKALATQFDRRLRVGD